MPAEIVQIGPATLYRGDCLEVLPTLDRGSIGAVVSDPPYGQTNEDYDSPIACEPEVWRGCFAVAADSASLVSFAGSPTYHRITTAIESAGWKVRQMWGWVYRDGMIASAYPREGFDRLAPAMDPLCFATKGKVLLPLVREGESEWVRSARNGGTYSARSCDKKAATRAVGRYPKTLVSDGSHPFEYFAYRRAKSDPDRTSHPNQKPVGIMSWILSKLPAGCVLDPFMGSGTTGVAAIEAGRPFVGIELNPKHFATACDRIGKAVGSPRLFA